ncbi:BC1881 family protein [Sporosarcina jiandibaonis]|uniref:BC1881 family protein n=1 Tax=Sporosarcina jiandibaonis TaxID=2715535 RepID=UPI001554F7B8|nr:BC1881 family protein [Sporosarcina jiandibaonis]
MANEKELRESNGLEACSEVDLNNALHVMAEVGANYNLYDTKNDDTPICNNKGYEEVADGIFRKKDTPIGDLKVRLTADLSEYITGLKAVQREAKKATQALRELEATRNRDTYVLHEELLKREGVHGIEVAPHEKVEIRIGEGACRTYSLTGPIRIIVNKD